MKWMKWMIHRCCNIGNTPLSLLCWFCQTARGSLELVPQGVTNPCSSSPQLMARVALPFPSHLSPLHTQTVPSWCHLELGLKLKLALMLDQREMLWFQALSVHFQYTISISSKRKPTLQQIFLTDGWKSSQLFLDVLSFLLLGLDHTALDWNVKYYCDFFGISGYFFLAEIMGFQTSWKFLVPSAPPYLREHSANSNFPDTGQV